MRDRFADICPAGAMVGPDRLRGMDPGYCDASRAAGLLLRPDSTAMVAAICRRANDTGTPIVAQGGLTGLTDATATTDDQVALSLDRMTRILRVDPLQRIIIAEAGATIADLDRAAAEHGLTTGIDIPSRDSATLGGAIATNAGGVRVIRYGMTRDNVLGLTAVLADGRIIEEMNTLPKDNTGYDLKQMFIGAEGTLGIVTAAVLRLYPRPGASASALLACRDLGAAQAVLAMAQVIAPGSLLSFEAMWPDFYRLTTSLLCPGREPLAPGPALHLIVEVTGATQDAAQALLLSIFEAAAERDLVQDGVIAKSDSERAAIWAIREDTDLIARPLGAMLSFDVSIEADRIDDFLRRWDDARERDMPDIQSHVFGHLGDCNLHVCVALTPQAKQDRGRIDDLFYATLAATPGASFSAEHGIGLQKRARLAASKSPDTLSLMRQLKRMLDPKGIMNPGKVLDQAR
ncbi:FAD-binding oxidoreductase [Paracoccus sediminilitoris]|uniref:FAD-binding oxidoreductase n=1 Tax=Paracoccus sediminilitoris TaxID=2202419 RepID=UPI000DB9C4BA|nr:FAD-binding oxidoreductase [Paracoccus sediminilitoris]